jgi:hypothetical protein
LQVIKNSSKNKLQEYAYKQAKSSIGHLKARHKIRVVK